MRKRHPYTNRKKAETAWLYFLGVLLVLTLAGCASATPAPPTPVTVQLKWVHQAQFAGIYAAIEQGYYAEENIEVTLVEGGPGIDILDPLVTGEVDFSIVAPETLIVRRSQGDPLIAIATIYRKSPVVIIALADSGIERPTDLIGHSMAVAGTTDLEMLFYALMNKLDIDIQGYKRKAGQNGKMM